MFHNLDSNDKLNMYKLIKGNFRNKTNELMVFNEVLGAGKLINNIYKESWFQGHWMRAKREREFFWKRKKYVFEINVKNYGQNNEAVNFNRRLSKELKKIGKKYGKQVVTIDQKGHGDDKHKMSNKHLRNLCKIDKKRRDRRKEIDTMK